LAPLNESEFVEFLAKHRRRDVPAAGVAKLIGRMIPQSLRNFARVVATDALMPLETLKARRYARAAPLKLNLGCGSLSLPGWVNIDLVGLPVDLRWNLSRKLPFADNSIDAIFHEHVQEHIDAYQGYFLTKECFRVLKPGGIYRVVMPDANKYIRSYMDPHHAFLREWRGLPFTPMMSLVEEFYGFNHRSIYDYETLDLYMRMAGFSRVEPSEMGKSRIAPCPDSEWRSPDSFYVEAEK